MSTTTTTSVRKRRRRRTTILLVTVMMAATVVQSARIAVVGGGASGIFAAIHSASGGGPAAASVVVLEATQQLLKKVKISGGGRCNVLHDHTKSPNELLAGYPRGNKELRGILSKHFPAPAAAAWFERHNVSLKTEMDGRMFPITDSSQTVIDALLNAARDNGVDIQTRCQVDSIDWISNNSNNNNGDNSGASSSSSSTSSPSGGSFRIHYRRKPPDGGGGDPIRCIEEADAVILATGSSPAGYALLQKSSSSWLSSSSSSSDAADPTTKDDDRLIMVPTVPSLFTLRTSNDLLDDLAGISVPHAAITYRPPPPVVDAGAGTSNDGANPPPPPKAVNDGRTTSSSSSSNSQQQKAAVVRRGGGDNNVIITQTGALLITHDRGLSGPAALRLSAFAAFAMAAHQYRGTLSINWLGGDDGDDNGRKKSSSTKTNNNSENDIFDHIWSMTTRHPQRTVGHSCPVADNDIPKRLWWALVEKAAGLDRNKRWADISKAQGRALAGALVNCPLDLIGKGTFKEEFVTAGGISLSAIDMKTMQCKYRPGLFVCGELINVDGITGGYNFMNCWGTGYVAGISAKAYVEQALSS
jgi:predicted flavoprotein YhiN